MIVILILLTTSILCNILLIIFARDCLRTLNRELNK